MKFSVVLCVFNGQSYLRKAIDSVLTQSYTDLELIIIEDFSTDGSVNIINSYLHDQRVKFIKNPSNLGLFKSRNIGLNNATGDWVAFIDQDDFYGEERLIKYVSLINRFPDIKIFFSDVNILNQKTGATTRFSNKFKFLKTSGIIKSPRNRMLIFGNYIATCSVVISRYLIDMVGEFNENYTYTGDYDYYLRCFKYSELYFNSELLSTWRVHDTQQSNVNKLRYKESVENTISHMIFFDIVVNPLILVRILYYKLRAFFQIQ